MRQIRVGDTFQERRSGKHAHLVQRLPYGSESRRGEGRRSDVVKPHHGDPLGNGDPSGKLPVTFPRTVGQIPLYYSHLNTGRPTGNSSGALRFENEDLIVAGG